MKLGFAVVLALSAALALRLQVTADISSLMPEHSRLSGALLDAFNDFGTTDRLIVVLETTRLDDAGATDRRRGLKALGDQLVSGMRQSGMFSAVACSVSPADRAFFDDLLSRYPFHYHSPEQLQSIRPMLEADEIEARVADLVRSLRASPLGTASQPALLWDPLGFRSEAESASGSFTGLKLDLSDGYFFSRDGSSLLILAEPAEPSQDTAFDAALLEELERLFAAAGGSEAFGPDYSMQVNADTRVQLIGPYVETLYGSKAAGREILPSILATCLGLLILFAAVYRNLRVIVILAVPLLAGILMISGAVSIVAGQLTMITVGFATMLAGLGVDFEIHLLERAGQESTNGRLDPGTFARAFATTGRGVVAGGLSTATIFLLIATSDFGALTQFGWIMGLGILLILAAVFVLLPALAADFPIAWRPVGRGGVSRWADWVVARYRLVAWVGVVLTALLGYCALDLKLESNIYRLGPMNPAYEQAKARVLERVGGSTNVVMVIAEREQLEDLLVVAEDISSVLGSLQAGGRIDAYESVSALLPSRRLQGETIREVRQWGLAGAMSTFASALGSAGFRVAAFEPFMRNVLRYGEDPGPVIGLEEFAGTPAQAWVDRLLVRSKLKWRAVTFVYPVSGQWQEEVPGDIVAQLEGLDAGIVVTGTVPVFKEISNLVRAEFLRLTLFALAAVLTISIAFFRRPVVSVLSAVPAIAGLIWTLGLMKLLGIELNLITMLVAPMILGLGIDDAVHVVSRYREEPRQIARAVADVARGVVMTSATTIIGFGSLVFAGLPSLRALGLTVSVGMVCCTVTSLFLLPALLRAFDTRG